MIRGHITISAHARMRLQERVRDVPVNNYPCFVSAARYNGKTPAMLSREEQKGIQKIRNNNSTQLRLYRGYVFIFGGKDHKARTLITVYKLENGGDEQDCAS